MNGDDGSERAENGRLSGAQPGLAQPVGEVATAAAGAVATLTRGLVHLARELGGAPRQYAILGEGNISARLDAGTMLIKASGASLATADDAAFIPVHIERALALVQAPPGDAWALASMLQATVVGAASARPSVETGMHAVLLGATGARWIAHTHPAPIVGVLSSRRPLSLVDGFLFPDQVVVCGLHPLWLPYIDPGIPLAQALAAALARHLHAHGTAPRAIYLQNHGFVAAGRSAEEVLAITDMAVKAALVLAVAHACGGPRYLPRSEVDHIAARRDEHHRQRMLGLTEEGTGAGGPR